MRLQKLIAEAGIASRRAAERLILDGRVTVNGVTVRQLGSTVVPDIDVVQVDGVSVERPSAKSYLLLHKPAGYVTSVSDPHAAHTIMSLLPQGGPRLFPVGRLDRDSEGLLLLTDDGALAERLLHPRNRVEREYLVLVQGDVPPHALAALRAGGDVDGARVQPLSVTIGEPPAPFDRVAIPGTRWLRMTLAEGRKREVRVLCAGAGLRVLRLIRIRFGPLLLGDLPAGGIRPLTANELSAIRDLPKEPDGGSVRGSEA